MKKDAYVNVPLLRDHLSGTREASRLAYELNNCVSRLKYHDLLAGNDRCFRIQKDTTYVNDLLRNLLKTMEELCDETEETIRTNKQLLAESESDARAVLRRMKE